MGIKITASEHNVRLQRLSEDDTMFVSFPGSIVHLRMYQAVLVLVALRRFFIIVLPQHRDAGELFYLILSTFKEYPKTSPTSVHFPWTTISSPISISST